MNKTYRTVWSAVTGSWVAAPETAKGHKKGGSKAISAAVSSLVMTLGGGSLPAEAAGGGAGIEICENGTATGINSTVCSLPSSGGVQDGWGLFTNNGAGFTTNEPAFVTGMKQGYVTLYGQNGVYSWSDLYMNGANDVLGGTGTAHKIKGLAAGDLTTVSQDAVNGSQLYATNQSINNLRASGTMYFHANSAGADSTAAGANSIAIGQAATAGFAGDIALGLNATTLGAFVYPAMAIGRNAQAIATGTMAIGVNALANVNAATVLGYDSTASGDHAVAIGANTFATAAATAALGGASTAGANYTTALGFGAKANNASDVALGSNSTTAAVTNTTGATIGGKVYTFAGSNAGSTVSVGSVGSERTVTNVAAGRLSATSTDAVNGSQLYAADQATDKNTADISNAANSINTIFATGTKYFHANSMGADSTAAGADSIAIGQAAVAVNWQDIALGVGATATGINPFPAIAIGTNAQASGTSTIALGTATVAKGNSALAMSYGATASGTGSAALGYIATASGFGAAALGYGATANNADDVALGAFSKTAAVTNTTGATIGGKAYTFAGSNAASTVSVGSVGGERTVTNVAAGRLSATSTDAVNGSQVFATDQAVNQNTTDIANAFTAINNLKSAGTMYFHANSTGADSVAAGVDAIAIGTVAQASGASSVAIGNGANAGGIADASGITVAVGAMSTASANYSTALGSYSKAAGEASTALGVNATASGERGVALGASALASGSYSSAIGTLSTASGANAAAFGEGAKATHANDVALGSNSMTAAVVNTTDATIGGKAYTFAGSNAASTVSVGSVGGERTVTNVAAGRLSSSSTDAVNGSQLYAADQAINQNTTDINNAVNSINSIVATGTKYFHANSTGDDSTALGLDSVAIGQGAMATKANDIALGSNSTTADVVNTAGATIGGKDYAFAGSNAQSTLSVGSVGAERTVTNVAAGRLSAGSTDAVNGSQLFATNQAVDQNTADISNTVNSINTIVATGTKYFHANSTGEDSAATGLDAIAIGQRAVAAHANSIALGSNSITSEAVATAGIAINGINYAFAGSAPAGTLSVGSSGAERTITNVAAGRITATSTDAVNGSQLHATNQAVSSLQTEVSNISTDVNALNNASVKYDTHADGTPDTSSITLSGGAYDSSTRTGGTAIHNVAYGVKGGDAVNVSQLNEVIGAVTNVANAANNPFMAAEGNRDTEGAVASGTHSTAMGAQASATRSRATAIGSGATAAAANAVALGAGSVAERDNSVSVGSTGNERQITNVAAGTQGTDAVNLSQMNQGIAQGVNRANTYTDQRIDSLGSQVASVSRGAYAGVAAATALSMIPDVDLGKTIAVGVGTANYKGYQAAALGASARVTANIKLKLGAGVSAAGTAVGGGASYQW